MTIVNLPLMPTYIYETISSTPERFEVRQGFNEPVLTVHPSTGEPVRRVISGGLAVMPNGMSAADGPDHGGGCGPATCGCGRFN